MSPFAPRCLARRQSPCRHKLLERVSGRPRRPSSRRATRLGPFKEDMDTPDDEVAAQGGHRPRFTACGPETQQKSVIGAAVVVPIPTVGLDGLRNTDARLPCRLPESRRLDLTR